MKSPGTMQNREKLLAIGFGIAILLWFGGGIVSDRVFGPFAERGERLKTLTTDVERLQGQAAELALARKRLTEWKGASLPPDRDAAASKKPSATDAQRLYQAWLTDLGHLAGFDAFAVKPGGAKVVKSGTVATAKTAYIAVPLTVETEGRFNQLCTFLDYFYRANLVHRVSNLKIESNESEGDPILKIVLNVEGLALIDVPWRRTLFPETTLVNEIDDKASRCEVASSEAFPKKPPFRIRIGREYATVTAIDGAAWTIERGADRTFAANHAAQSVVELAPTKPGVPSRSMDEFREILAANVFIKPPPPKEYKLKVGPITPPAFARGSTLDYTIPVSNYDPTLGKPEFVLVNEAPPGLKLDRGIGKLVWTPDPKQPIGTFPLKLEVRHPSAPDGVATAEVVVTFREPNSRPTAKLEGQPVAYLGRPWSYPLQVEDPETPAHKLVFKLNSPPAGLTIDSSKRTLEWTPPATQPAGEITVTVDVTDDGIPPNTLTMKIPVKVQDDDAQFTFLVGSVAVDGAWQAWLYNRAQDKRTVIRVGDSVQISDIQGTVAEIGKDFVVLKQGDAEHRLQLGKNLRELSSTAAAEPSKT